MLGIGKGKQRGISGNAEEEDSESSTRSSKDTHDTEALLRSVALFSRGKLECEIGVAEDIASRLAALRSPAGGPRFEKVTVESRGSRIIEGRRRRLARVLAS